MAQQFETHIVTYHNHKEYERQAPQMAKQGWTVVSVTEERPRSGCLRMIFLGFFALVFHPAPKIIVTYQRPKPTADNRPTA